MDSDRRPRPQFRHAMKTTSANAPEINFCFGHAVFAGHHASFWTVTDCSSCIRQTAARLRRPTGPPCDRQENAKCSRGLVAVILNKTSRCGRIEKPAVESRPIAGRFVVIGRRQWNPLSAAQMHMRRKRKASFVASSWSGERMTDKSAAARGKEISRISMVVDFETSPRQRKNAEMAKCTACPHVGRDADTMQSHSAPRGVKRVGI